jgi:hypothetical protein
MNDAQIIAISITVLAVVAVSVFNNVRIGDVSIGLNRRIDDMRDVLRAEMNGRLETMGSEMNRRFERMDSKLDTIINMLGQLETRVTKHEGRSS